MLEKTNKASEAVKKTENVNRDRLNDVLARLAEIPDVEALFEAVGRVKEDLTMLMEAKAGEPDRLNSLSAAFVQTDKFLKLITRFKKTK